MMMPETPAAVPTMIPHYDTSLVGGLYEGIPAHPPKPTNRFMFKVPRVVADQKHKFETDELFKRLSRESEVSYNIGLIYYLLLL